MKRLIQWFRCLCNRHDPEERQTLTEWGWEYFWFCKACGKRCDDD